MNATSANDERQRGSRRVSSVGAVGPGLPARELGTQVEVAQRHLISKPTTICWQ